MIERLAGQLLVNEEKSKCASSILCQFSVRAGNTDKYGNTETALNYTGKQKKTWRESISVYALISSSPQARYQARLRPLLFCDDVMDRSELVKLLGAPLEFASTVTTYGNQYTNQGETQKRLFSSSANWHLRSLNIYCRWTSGSCVMFVHVNLKKVFFRTCLNVLKNQNSWRSPWLITVNDNWECSISSSKGLLHRYAFLLTVLNYFHPLLISCSRFFFISPENFGNHSSFSPDAKPSCSDVPM